MVLPLESGDYRLAWRVRAFHEERFDIRQTFYDALTGEVLLDYSDLQTQAAGLGTGVLGDRKKLSVAPAGGGFTTSDRLRPPAISTYDFLVRTRRVAPQSARLPNGAEEPTLLLPPFLFRASATRAPASSPAPLSAATP